MMSPLNLKLGNEHYVVKLLKAYINDDHELTLTYFMIMSNCKTSFCTYEACSETIKTHAI